MGIPTLFVSGPSSGTFTADASTNRIGVYMSGGGGNTGTTGLGGMCPPFPVPGGTGGRGGFGFYNKPITQPFSQPFSVGANAGNTTVANVGTVNAGNNGGNSIVQGGSGASGNQGSAPGASLANMGTKILVIQSSNADQPGTLAIFENNGT